MKMLHLNATAFRTLLACSLGCSLLLLSGCQGQVGPDPTTGNPASETPAEFRQRIEQSDLSEEEKARRLAELDRMKQMNEAFLQQGQPQNLPPNVPATR